MLWSMERPFLLVFGTRQGKKTTIDSVRFHTHRPMCSWYVFPSSALRATRTSGLRWNSLLSQFWCADARFSGILKYLIMHLQHLWCSSEPNLIYVKTPRQLINCETGTTVPITPCVNVYLLTLWRQCTAAWHLFNSRRELLCVKTLEPWNTWNVRPWRRRVWRQFLMRLFELSVSVRFAVLDISLTLDYSEPSPAGEEVEWE